MNSLVDFSNIGLACNDDALAQGRFAVERPPWHTRAMTDVPGDVWQPK